MKERVIDKYYPKVENIVGSRWGGSCTPYPTTRKGIRYFVCAENSGYVVDTQRITKDEARKIQMFMEPHIIHLGVQLRNTGFVVIGVDEGIRKGSKTPKRLSYDPELGRAVWVEYPLFLGSEDDGWCVIEKLTGVRVKTDERVDYAEIAKHDEAMERCYERHLDELKRRSG